MQNGRAAGEGWEGAGEGWEGGRPVKDELEKFLKKGIVKFG